MLILCICIPFSQSLSPEITSSELRRLPDVNITIDSPIPLVYSDDGGTHILPGIIVHTFDLGFAVCDGRYADWKCWERWEECVIYEDYIIEYKGVVNKTINFNGYRGVVRIDFTTCPYTMHVLITDYPSGPLFDPWGYDVDENGTIEKSEVIAAIQDYFDNQITKEQLIKVIQLYFR
jgi:hypothetical protein